MELDLLTAISPIDGRYRGKTDALAAYFSEFALVKYRVQVEVEYFITLCELPLPQLKGVDKSVFETLRNIYRNFSEADAQRIKDIESVTNHDVKAVEYFLKEEFDKMGGMDDYKEFIHFGLTSQDINNTSVWFSLDAAGQRRTYNNPLFVGSLNNTFTLPAGFLLSADFNYQSRGQVQNITLKRPQYTLNIGLRKSLFNDALSIEARANDLLLGCMSCIFLYVSKSLFHDILCSCFC